MAMHLIKEDRKTGDVICQKSSQTMVESDVIVPDVKPDIKKVLEISSTVCITQKSIQQDKVFLQGVIRMTVLYLPDGDSSGRLCSLFVTQDFNHSIDARGAMPDMQLSCEALAETVDHTLLNSRKVNLRCVLGLGIKVVRPILLSLATGVEADTEIALKKERLRLLGNTETCECQIILREQLEFPSGKPTIGEILRITAVPTATELRLMDNKAVAKGQVRVCTLYSSDTDHSVQFMEHLLPFTEILDMDGATEGMDGDIDFSLADMYYEIRDDSDGEPRNLGLELVLAATVRGSEVTEIDAVTDAYSLCGELELTCGTHHIEQLLDNSTAELSHKDQAQVPSMLPPLKQVCDVNASARIDRISVEGEQITVYGTLRTNILYLTADETVPVSGFSHLSEFSQVFSVAGADSNTACDAQVYLDHVSYTLSGNDSLELRFILGLTVKSLKTGDTVFVEDIALRPDAGKLHPCIVLYFVQKGDSLWKIAKEYHTTVEALKSLNNLDCDTIYPGQRLKILAKCA
ncbi:MAG: DUF3794 domain-containing protein [Clostridia bacterium]|nr:DUF3794 domain-containing protein [Clostridia bacterium]